MPARADTAPETGQSFNQSQKITVSLFPADDARLTAIQGALAKRNRRASASQIVRLALRSLPVTDAGEIADKAGETLVSMLDAMSDEDGRSKRFSWNSLPQKVVSKSVKTAQKRPKTGRGKRDV